MLWPGSFIFALGVNVLITPLGLYNGGFMGIAQLLRTFVVQVLHVPVPGGLDLSGLIYFIMNYSVVLSGIPGVGKAVCGKDTYYSCYSEYFPDDYSHSGDSGN